MFRFEHLKSDFHGVILHSNFQPRSNSFNAAAGSSKDGKPPAKTDVADKDAPFAADWNSNKDGCQDKFPSLQAYAALQRYEARRAG